MKNTFSKISIFTFMILCSCSPTFLDEKPSSSLVVPQTLSDFSQLLNNQLMFETSDLPEISSDDYYLKYDYWQTLPDITARNAHIWEADLYGSKQSEDSWNRPYHQILYANVVLKGLKDIVMEPSNEYEWKRIAGSALFVRGYAFFNLAQLFAPPYFMEDQGKGLGIPIKLTEDINEKVPRSSVHETYGQIIDDLVMASTLLPQQVSPGSPNRAAAYAMLARTFLSMADYRQAMKYADSCLALHDTLLDFNSISASSYGVKTGILYGTGMSYPKLMTYYATNILTPPKLYESYHPNDLRRTVYYRQNTQGDIYKGYSHSYYFHFTGLATDEIYLIRAECRARLGRVQEGLDDLNHLMQYRYKTGTYTPMRIEETEDVLSLILQERRKELVFRNLRWTDLRRLNLEGARMVITRSLNGQVYKLTPNSVLWVLPIPRDEISINGITQNVRSVNQFYYGKTPN